MSGDPRRCPECGSLNPLGELELTAEAVSRQLRGFENAPILCVLCIGCAACLYFFAVEMTPRGSVLCLLFAAAAPSIGWIVGAARFHAFCLGKTGWFAALVKYHVYALMMIAVVVAAYAGWHLLTRMMFGPFNMPVLYYLLTLAFTAGMIVAIRWLLPRLHRRFRVDTLFLRREITIAIARDQIRNQMRRGPR